MIFAYLNKDEVPVLCSWYEWKEWWKREGDRCQVKYDRIDDWEIETRFQGRSAALDGPPLFWDVRFFGLTSRNGIFSTLRRRTDNGARNGVPGFDLNAF